MKHLEHLLGVCGESHLNLYHLIIVLILYYILYRYGRSKTDKI